MRDLEEIKRIPIITYLEKMGVSVPARGNIAAFWRGDKNPSVSIDRAGNRWYDHGTGQGGSVLDLVMVVEGCNFAQAAERLESGGFSAVSIPSVSRAERKPAFVIDDVRFLRHPALLQYLNSRGISSSLACLYCREIHYRFEKSGSQFFAIGFQQRGGGWELRNSKIKLATAKCYSYIDNGGSHLAVFEGFMDFLSYLEIPDALFPKRSPENYLVLNSVALVDWMLRDLKAGKMGAISTATLGLDADEAGRKTSAKIEKAFGEIGIRVLEDVGARLEEFGPGVKDINDALICYQQQTR